MKKETAKESIHFLLNATCHVVFFFFFHTVSCAGRILSQDLAKSICFTISILKICQMYSDIINV